MIRYGGIQIIDQVHVHPGDGIIGSEALKQLIKFKFTYFGLEKMRWHNPMNEYSNNLSNSRTGWRRMKRMIRWGTFKQLSKFTYILETNWEDGIGWSDVGYSNNWASWRTLKPWRQIKSVGWYTSIQIISLIHVRAGDGWRGWDRMIRCGVFQQLSIVHVHSQAVDGWRG